MTTNQEQFTFHLAAGTHATVTLMPGERLSEDQRYRMILMLRRKIILGGAGRVIVIPDGGGIDKIEFQHGQGREV